MHIFRIFAVSVLIPLISVGLCASGENKSRHKTVLISEVKPRRLDNANPSIVRVSLSGSEKTRDNHDSLPYHPHPLKLEIRGIQNSTRVDEFGRLFDERRDLRDYHHEFEGFSWIWNFAWKAMTSYMIVACINMFLSPFLKKFGWGGPYWETSISLGNDGSNPILNPVFPSIKQLRVSFDGNKGSSGKDDNEQSGPPGWGWGPPGGGGMHAGGIPIGNGHQGYGTHGGTGWLSYDQYALALPQVDKYSLKAAKKSAHFAKKATKYAQKASKAAAKAQAYRLQVKPTYANAFLHPSHLNTGHLPLPAYGWKK